MTFSDDISQEQHRRRFQQYCAKEAQAAETVELHLVCEHDEWLVFDREALVWVCPVCGTEGEIV